MIMVALPGFANMMLEVAKKVMSQKLRDRIMLLKDMSELENEIAISILPAESGGLISQSEMLKSFRELSDQRMEMINSINEGVDWERVAFENDNESCSIM